MYEKAPSASDTVLTFHTPSAELQQKVEYGYTQYEYCYCTDGVFRMSIYWCAEADMDAHATCTVWYIHNTHIADAGM